MANIMDLMRYASRKAIGNFNDDPQAGIGRAIQRDSDPAADSWDPADQHPFRYYGFDSYHDPENDVLVEVPGVDKYKNSKKGEKQLKKSIQKEKLPIATDELPDRGSAPYNRLYDDVIRRQRGPKEKM